MVLTCKATGEELLNYEWIRSSGSLSEMALDNNGTQLIISDITVNDSGEYYCRVHIGGISVPSMRVNITVKSMLNCFTIGCSLNKPFTSSFKPDT